MLILLVYDSIGKLVDIPNYSDYFIAEMYYVNPDWPVHNTKYWRTFADGSKWRYIMTDMDFGLGLYSQSTKMNCTGYFTPLSYGPTTIGHSDDLCKMLTTGGIL